MSALPSPERAHRESVLRRALGNQRGTALIYTGIFMLAFAGFTLLSMDVAQQAFVATEVQTAASAAAVAAARAVAEHASPTDAANGVLAGNTIYGHTAADNLVGLETGTWSPEANTFHVGGLDPNAVRATVAQLVNNFAGGFFGAPESTVMKIAVAAIGPLGRSRPILPVAIGDCAFDSGCEEPDCLPSLIQVPSQEDNTGWSGFFEGTGTASGVMPYFPEACGGENAITPEMSVGQEISMDNGQVTPLLRAVDCVVNELGLNGFLVPVVSCDTQFNQFRPVVGFATLVIDLVDTEGAYKRIDGHAVMVTVPGPIGGSNFGTISVRLVG